MLSFSACHDQCVVDETNPLQLISTIQVPDAPLAAFDISWLDPVTETFYLADRANAGIEVVDARSHEYVRRIGGFAGDSDHARSGPNGLLVVPDSQQLWAADGDSSVKVVDLDSGHVQSISTGGAARADELSFDADDHILLVVNNEEERTDDPDSGPFATLISGDAPFPVIGKLRFHRASAGLEQSAWDPVSGHMLLAIPELDDDKASGAIALIDPRKAELLALFPVSECQPAGIALGPHQELLVGCSGDAIEAGFAARSLILDARNGALLARIPEVGGSDEVWFNPGDMHYYLAARDNPGGPVLGVIDALSRRWTMNVATVADAKSVAVDPVDNQVFVALTPTTEAFANVPERGLHCEQGCIGVFATARTCAPEVPWTIGSIRARSR
jgi:DNA-binding beta-propeller fold protein YncE